MDSPRESRWLTSSYVAVSAVVTAASLRSALQFASIPEPDLDAWWWLPSTDFARDLSPVGWMIFLLAAFALGSSVESRSQGRVAASTAGTTIAVYLVLLDRWSTRPGPYIDPRIAYTSMFSLVALYVAMLGLAAHAVIAWRKVEETKLSSRCTGSPTSTRARRAG